MRILEAYTSDKTSAEVVACLEKWGVPAAEVRDPKEAVRDPRVVSRGETVPLAHPKYGMVEDVYGMGMPIKFSRAQAGFDKPPPGLGRAQSSSLWRVCWAIPRNAWKN